MINISLISFASKKWEQAAIRFLNQATDINIFSNIKIFNEDELNNKTLFFQENKNFLKSFYVVDAIKNSYIKDSLVAWIDFGYCRDKEEDLMFTWQYPFEIDKIYLFNMKEINSFISISQTVYTGDVYIQGGHIIAGIDKWLYLNNIMKESFYELMNNGLVDDDQTILLMSYLKDPNSFILKYNSDTDWFRVFKDYRKTI